MFDLTEKNQTLRRFMPYSLPFKVEMISRGKINFSVDWLLTSRNIHCDQNPTFKRIKSRVWKRHNLEQVGCYLKVQKLINNKKVYFSPRAVFLSQWLREFGKIEKSWSWSNRFGTVTFVGTLNIKLA